MPADIYVTAVAQEAERVVHSGLAVRFLTPLVGQQP